jgi:hypothetical protein
MNTPDALQGVVETDAIGYPLLTANALDTLRKLDAEEACKAFNSQFSRSGKEAVTREAARAIYDLLLHVLAGLDDETQEQALALVRGEADHPDPMPPRLRAITRTIRVLAGARRYVIDELLEQGAIRKSEIEHDLIEYPHKLV